MNATPQRLLPRPETREVRVRFASSRALSAGLLRAGSEPWVRSARIDWVRNELVLALAGAAQTASRDPRLPVAGGGGLVAA